MHWYGGSIAEAVNLSKQRNAIFVVFVEGNSFFNLFSRSLCLLKSVKLVKTSIVVVIKVKI